MKKYLNAENLTAFAIVVLGVWVAMATYDSVRSAINKAKAKAGA